MGKRTKKKKNRSDYRQLLRRANPWLCQTQSGRTIRASGSVGQMGGPGASKRRIIRHRGTEKIDHARLCDKVSYVNPDPKQGENKM